MAIVNEEDGFTQLTKLNILDEFLIKGEPVFTVSGELLDGQVIKFDITKDAFVYAGATVDPGTGEWTFDNSINVPQGTINISDTLSISEATLVIFTRDNVLKQNFLNVSASIDETGTGLPSIQEAPSVINVVAQPDDSETITINPVLIPILASFDNETDTIIFRAAAPMANVRMTLTDINTGIILKYLPNKASVVSGTDGMTFVVGDNVVNMVNNDPDSPGVSNVGFTPLRLRAGELGSVLIEADSVALLGNASNIPYLENDIHPLFTTTIAREFDTSNIADDYLRLNNTYTVTSGTPVGIVANYLAEAEADTVTDGQFTAGVASTSNPAVVTDGSDTFTQGDLIQIQSSVLNSGIFEVEDHTGTLLTVRGVGTVQVVEGFTQSDFIATISDATITKINVAIIRAGENGLWEEGKGSETGIIFSNVSGLPLSTVRYVDAGTGSLNRDGSLGNPFISITEALASITDNTSLKQYVLRIAPATYNEGALLTLKPFISLEGYGQATRVIITSTDFAESGAGSYGFQNVTFNGEFSFDISALSTTIIAIANTVINGNFTLLGAGAGDTVLFLRETLITGVVTIDNIASTIDGVNFIGSASFAATAGTPDSNSNVSVTNFISCRLTGGTVDINGPLQHSCELSNSVIDDVFTADGSLTTIDLFVDSYPNNLFFTNGAQGNLRNEIDAARQGFKNDSTTLVRGGEITEGALNTQMDIAAGVGTIYDYSDPAQPEAFPVTFGPFTDVDITDIGSQNFTIVAIDRNSTVQQFSPGSYSFIERRDLITLGTVSHPAGTFNEYFRNSITTQETHSQFLDLLDCLGVIRCEGLVVQPNADLTFDKTSGVVMNPGAGTAQGNRPENAAFLTAESPTTFNRLLGITSTTTAINQNDVDPSSYDDGSGTPVSIPGANRATIQYIFQFPADETSIVMYGQTVYDNLDDAVSMAAADNPTIPDFIRQDALLVARIALEDGATDLSDDLQAVFLPGSKFGVDITGGSGGSGGGGGDVFGPANSTVDEIATYDDATGKILKSNSDITALDGDISRSTVDDDLKIIQNGTGSVQFGPGNILSNIGASNIGGTIFSLATPLAGNAVFQFEHNGVAIGDIGYRNFPDNLRFVDISTNKGIHIEANGQISLGELSVEPDFSVIINGDEKPFGLPNLTTANEGALTPQQRMIHYNSVLDRVRYYDGTQFQSVANLNDIAPLSILRYVDNNTSATVRNGSIGAPYISSTEARAAITDNAIGKQYTLVIIEDDGTSNDPKPFIYQRGVNGQNFTGGARVPNTVGRYEYSNMVVGNVNSDNLTVAAESVFTDVEFLAASLIFTISTTTLATAKFIRCKFNGKMDFRQVDAEFIDCEINNIELIDGTLTPKTWIFRNCTFNGTMTTSGSSIGCNFTFVNCHWLSSSSLSAGYPLIVTCDSTFPHESNGQVTISTRIAEAVVVDYDNSGSTLTSDNVKEALDELADRSNLVGGRGVLKIADNVTKTVISSLATQFQVNFGVGAVFGSPKNFTQSGNNALEYTGDSYTGIVTVQFDWFMDLGNAPDTYNFRIALFRNGSEITNAAYLEPDMDKDEKVIHGGLVSSVGLANGDILDLRIRQSSGGIRSVTFVNVAMAAH